MTPGLEMLARSMARVMGAWLGPRVETGEMHTMASASLLYGQAGCLRQVTGGLQMPCPHSPPPISAHLTNWHSPSLMVTVTLLPASRELPEMVSRVPPEAGPRVGLTRSNIGVWGRSSPEGREEPARCRGCSASPLDGGRERAGKGEG